jgi:hypothetical protein
VENNMAAELVKNRPRNAKRSLQAEEDSEEESEVGNVFSRLFTSTSEIYTRLKEKM